MTKITVIGAGAWGTALAQCYGTAGHDVTLWVREKDLAKRIIETGRNDDYLPNVELHKSIDVTDDLSTAASTDIILNVTPAQYLRDNLKRLAPFLRDGQPIVICAKGIELATHKLLSDVAAEETPKAEIAFLTGPNFAKDIANGLPSGSTLAARTKDIAGDIANQLTARNLRLYTTDDTISAQIAGALKNVIAIACGTIHGLGLGESARAALVTRGLAEIARLATSMGGQRETLMGLCGVGDMMLTCSSMTSRNFSLGAELASGKSLDDIMAARNSVAEGVPTAKAAHDLALERGIDMPITNAIYKCLYNGMSITDAIEQILNRPGRAEQE